MCGRFAYAPKINKEEDIQIIDRDNTLKISYNISPGMIISTLNSKYEVENLKWGLIPHWSKDLSIGNKLYNARSETAHEKPSFRKAFLDRCLIPVTGFYEWQKKSSKKIPYYIRLKNENTMYLAGICDSVEIDNQNIKTVSILTTSPNDIVKRIHNRMPVILSKEYFDVWLNGTKENLLQSNIFAPYSSMELDAYRVSDMINNASVNSEELIKNIDITLF